MCARAWNIRDWFKPHQPAVLSCADPAANTNIRYFSNVPSSWDDPQSKAVRIFYSCIPYRFLLEDYEITHNITSLRPRLEGADREQNNLRDSGIGSSQWTAQDGRYRAAEADDWLLTLVNPFSLLTSPQEARKNKCSSYPSPSPQGVAMKQFKPEDLTRTEFGIF